MIKIVIKKSYNKKTCIKLIIMHTLRKVKREESSHFFFIIIVNWKFTKMNNFVIKWILRFTLWNFTEVRKTINFCLKNRIDSSEKYL